MTSLDDEIRFDKPEDLRYDVLVMGTGLVQCLVAAAVAKCGKRVLHIDRNDYYGDEYATFDLKQFTSWLYSGEDDDDDVGGGTDDSWREVCANETATFLPLSYTSNLSNVPVVWHGGRQRTQKKEENDENQTDDDANDEDVWQQMMQRARSYALDLSPKLLYARGSMVDLLLKADVSKYLEFKLVEMVMMGEHNTDVGFQWHRVPISRADVFQNSSMNMIEKRRLMKLLQVLMSQEKKLRPEAQLQSTVDNVNEAEQQLKEYEDKPFIDFLKARSLSDNVANMMRYCVALQGDNEDLTTGDAVAQMGKFIQSLGRYGNGAFLHPMYGSGEIGQAFSRLCAVSGGVYVLRFMPQCVVYDSDCPNVCCGVITRAQQHIKCDKVVASTNYRWRPKAKPTTRVSLVSRCICIVDRPLVEVPPDSNSSSIATFTLPPTSQSALVTALQADWTVGACPQGQCVVHFATKSCSSSAVDDLLPVVSSVVNLSAIKGADDGCLSDLEERDPDDRPEAIWIAFYQQYDEEVRDNDTVPQFDNVYRVVRASDRQEVGFDSEVAEAERIFYAMYPDEVFFMAAPDESSGETEKKPTRYEEDDDIMAALSSDDDDDVFDPTADDI